MMDQQQTCAAYVQTFCEGKIIIYLAEAFVTMSLFWYSQKKEILN